MLRTNQNSRANDQDDSLHGQHQRIGISSNSYNQTTRIVPNKKWGQSGISHIQAMQANLQVNGQANTERNQSVPLQMSAYMQVIGQENAKQNQSVPSKIPANVQINGQTKIQQKQPDSLQMKAKKQANRQVNNKQKQAVPLQKYKGNQNNLGLVQEVARLASLQQMLANLHSQKQNTIPFPNSGDDMSVCHKAAVNQTISHKTRGDSQLLLKHETNADLGRKSPQLRPFVDFSKVKNQSNKSPIVNTDSDEQETNRFGQIIHEIKEKQSDSNSYEGSHQLKLFGHFACGSSKGHNQVPYVSPNPQNTPQPNNLYMTTVDGPNTSRLQKPSMHFQSGHEYQAVPLTQSTATNYTPSQTFQFQLEPKQAYSEPTTGSHQSPSRPYLSPEKIHGLNKRSLEPTTGTAALSPLGPTQSPENPKLQMEPDVCNSGSHLSHLDPNQSLNMQESKLTPTDSTFWSHVSPSRLTQTTEKQESQQEPDVSTDDQSSKRHEQQHECVVYPLWTTSVTVRIQKKELHASHCPPPSPFSSPDNRNSEQPENNIVSTTGPSVPVTPVNPIIPLLPSQSDCPEEMTTDTHNRIFSLAQSFTEQQISTKEVKSPLENLQPVQSPDKVVNVKTKLETQNVDEKLPFVATSQTLHSDNNDLPEEVPGVLCIEDSPPSNSPLQAVTKLRSLPLRRKIKKEKLHFVDLTSKDENINNDQHQGPASCYPEGNTIERCSRKSFVSDKDRLLNIHEEVEALLRMGAVNYHGETSSKRKRREKSMRVSATDEDLIRVKNGRCAYDEKRILPCSDKDILPQDFSQHQEKIKATSDLCLNNYELQSLQDKLGHKTPSVNRKRSKAQARLTMARAKSPRMDLVYSYHLANARKNTNDFKDKLNKPVVLH